MMAWSRTRALLACIVPGLLTILVACGGAAPSPEATGALSLEDYFEGVEAALARSEATPLDAPFPGEVLEDPAATLDEKKQAVKEFISAHLKVSEKLVADLESLDPPPEVEDAHQDFVLGFKGSLLLLEDFRDKELDAIESDADLTPMTVDEAFAKAFASPDACEELQTIAQSNNIDVQLNCSNR